MHVQVDSSQMVQAMRTPQHVYGLRRLTPDDAPALTGLFADHQWWATRTQSEVEAALVGSDLAMGVECDAEFIGSARVLTDYTFIAIIVDVIVTEAHRRNGHGSRLVSAIVSYNAIDDVRYVSVTCRRGIRDFYAYLGFREVGPTVDPPDGSEKLLRMTFERQMQRGNTERIH